MYLQKAEYTIEYFLWHFNQAMFSYFVQNAALLKMSRISFLETFFV